jgi:hypothetical protein
VIGRTAKSDARQSLGAHLRPQRFHQGRFADASLTADQDDLAQAGFALLPAAAQQPDFLIASDQERRPGRHKLLVMAGCRQQATHPAHRHGLGDAGERMGPKVVQGKGPSHEPRCHGADDHRVGRGKTLEPRRNVGRLPERQVLVPPTAPHHLHHDGAGVDAEPHGQLDAILCRQTGIQGGDGLDDAQAGVHRAPGLVFMGRGVAEIDQQPIAEVLGDVAFILPDDFRRGLLVGAHHGAPVFGVELTGELSGAHQVTEQHGELAAFGFGGRAGWRGGEHWHDIRWYARGLDHRVRWRGRPVVRPDAWEAPCPLQTLTLDIAGELFEDEILPHLVQARRVEAKELCQGAIREAPLALQEGTHQVRIQTHQGAVDHPREHHEALVTRPDQDTALFIHRHTLTVDELVLERLQVRLVELELQLEGAIRQAAPLAQQRDRLIYHRDKVHSISSTTRAGGSSAVHRR